MSSVLEAATIWMVAGANFISGVAIGYLWLKGRASRFSGLTASDVGQMAQSNSNKNKIPRVSGTMNPRHPDPPPRRP